MQDDIQQQTPSTPATTGKKKSMLSPAIAFLGVGGTVAVVFVVGLSIALSFSKWREPAPVTYAGGYSGQEDVLGSLDFPAGIDEGEAATCIENYITQKEPSSPLAKDVPSVGEKFITSGKSSTANINPTLMLAIANAESAFATTGIASNHPNLHNYFGYTATAADNDAEDIGSIRMKKFNTWEEAITEQGQYLRRMYLSKGITTIFGIRNRYAPVGAANDPTGLNSNWIKNVISTIKDIGQKCPAIKLQTGSLDGSTNKIVQLAMEEATWVDPETGAVGYHSEEGENCTKFNTVGSRCQQWCATFVTTIYKQAGYNMPVKAGTGEVRAFFSSNGHTFIENPTIDKIQGGDIIFIRSSSSASGFHVGIAKSTNDVWVNTIEGNHGRGENDKVAQDKRNITEVVGVARW